MGASSKTIHLRLAIADADEVLVFCWQTVLLRHFVPFTHQLAIPWDEAGRQAACSTGTGRRNHIPAHDWVILVHNNKLPLLLSTARCGEKLFPTNFSPFTQPYATYDAVLWKEE